MTLRKLRETQCVKMRWQFVLLPDSRECLMKLNTNDLCLNHLITSSIAVFNKHLGYDGRRIRHKNAEAIHAIAARED
jgi:hypothetical protein